MPQASNRPFLTYLLAGLAGAAAAAAAWFFTSILADYLLSLQGMSACEGARAMTAFFTFGPIGGVVGFILGIWLVLRYFGGYRRAPAVARRTLLVAAGVIGATALGLWLYAQSDDVLVRNGPPPQMEFELRLPAGSTLPTDTAKIRIDLNTDKNTMPALVEGLETDAGRPVISGRVELYFRTSHRLLVLRLPDEPDRIFTLGLPSNPDGSDEFGPWERVDYIADADEQPQKAGPGDDYEVRYRVERAVP